MKHADAGLFLLALAEVPQVMSAFAPSPFTARTFSDDPEKRAGLVRDLAAGSIVSVGIGAAVSMVVGSRAPFYGAMFVLAIFLLYYRHALNYAKDQGAQPMDRRAGGGAY